MGFFDSKNSVYIIEKPAPLNTLSPNSNVFLKAFKTNPVVFRALSLFVNVTKNIKFNTHKNWFQNENCSQFIKKIVHNLILTGNCFLEVFENKLEILPNLSLNLDENKSIIFYQYIKSGKIIKLQKEKVIHLKNMDSGIITNHSGNLGISPLEPALLAIQGHNAITEFMIGIIENGGRPTGIISYPENIGENQKENIKKELTKLGDNIENNRSIALISGGFKWENIGITPDKLQLLEMKIKFEKEIAMALNVPNPLIGLQDVHFSSYKEARKHFMEDNVIPLVYRIIHSINESINEEIISIIDA